MASEDVWAAWDVVTADHSSWIARPVAVGDHDYSSTSLNVDRPFGAAATFAGDTSGQLP